MPEMCGTSRRTAAGAAGPDRRAAWIPRSPTVALPAGARPGHVRPGAVADRGRLRPGRPVTRRPSLIALVLQLLVLPAVCFGLVLAFDLPPLLAVGLHAAGGVARAARRPTCSATSFRGDVALNITLTAVNSLHRASSRCRSSPTWRSTYFDPADGGSLGLQFGKTAAGVRHRARAGRPRHARPRSAPPGSPTAWTSRCGSSPRSCWRWSSSARSSPSGRTSAATSATSGCRRCCSAWSA